MTLTNYSCILYVDMKLGLYVKGSTQAESVSGYGGEEVLLAVRKKVGGRWRKLHNE